MTTSGTATFNPDLGELIEEAFERAGSELRSGYDLKSARRSINLMSAEWSNRGLNLWTVDSGTIAMVSGTATYNLPADTIDLIEVVIRTGAGVADTQMDYSMEQMSVSTYAQLPTKLDTGRPLNFFTARVVPPTITLWPVPDQTGVYTLVYWRLRRIQDSGQLVDNTMDIPSRFLPAFVAGLAYYLSMKIPGGAERAPALKSVYEEQFQMAADEDRDRSAVRIIPYVGSV